MTGFGKGTDLHNSAVVGNLPKSTAAPGANPSWSTRPSPTAMRIGANRPDHISYSIQVNTTWRIRPCESCLMTAAFVDSGNLDCLNEVMVS